MAISRLGFLIAVLALFDFPTLAATPIYRCTQNGQTILTDKPCDGASAAAAQGPASVSPPGAMVAPAPPPSPVVGDWRGQTQYQGTENGQHMADSQTVVPLILTFSADGKVTGSSAENGCKLLGLWSPGLTPRVFPLDLTLSACRDVGFNRRYSGNLLASFPDRSAQLFLQAYDVGVPGKPTRRYDVSATLRR